jgi:hypothetical protein
MKILEWDYVLGGCEEEQPIITFKPTLEFLNLLVSNNNELWVTITETGEEHYDGKSFLGVADKATITNPCPSDMSAQDMFYTLTLTNAPCAKGMKGGKISINEIVTPKYAEKPQSPETIQEKDSSDSSDNSVTSENTNSGSKLDVVGISLIGAITVVSIALIFLCRGRK